MKILYKKVFISAGVYLSLFFLSFILNLIAPGGPCAPGLAIIMVIIAPLITIILFFKDMHDYLINKNKNARLSFLLNTLVLLLFIVLLINF